MYTLSIDGARQALGPHNLICVMPQTGVRVRVDWIDQTRAARARSAPPLSLMEDYILGVDLAGASAQYARSLE